MPCPVIDIADGSTSVNVTIIDTGARITGPCSMFLRPAIQGHDQLSVPAYIFLVEHEKLQRRVLFDLGIRKNPEEYSPKFKKVLEHFHIDPGEEASEFLQSRGVDLNGLEAIIWSHHHVDHVGKPAGFPSTTALIVGPGFKSTMLPGYPENPDAEMLESDFEGRDLRQLDFDSESHGLEIGSFRAIDYFEDGSFFLLETPGHTIDHLVGLARTCVSPPRFMLMGGDIGHHASQWRPSEYLPLPTELSPSPLGPEARFNIRFNVCPGELFVEHVHPENSSTKPFYRMQPRLHYDQEMAQDALKRMEAFDADERILVIAAHDRSFSHILEDWPKNANEWHLAEWKQKSRWRFLRDFSNSLKVSIDAKRKQ
ncbi:Metallo-hydrolase/oxidoreductase [Aulographum hederae CBS 113979]|uniref:Metallo-hydrolase/oxidoreductase n=1 Tax=Aulographum hederae CBS 113979 TaxID=1176131 RepID=A0A6G1GNA3_9PEZI|nr:Metallo-hydrolase/oxidoreductase [Aulographum hederae CBS 113979]